VIRALMLVLTLTLMPAFARASLAQTDPLDIPQGGGIDAFQASDPQAIASAYGDLSVFVLNVAAGNDGVPQHPDEEAAFSQVFAQQFAGSFASLGQSEQATYAGLPETMRQIHQAWPSLPVQQRLGLRDQWAAAVQPTVASAPCELFDAMVRAQLVPSFEQYKSTNIAHLKDCWRQHPELTLDAQERAAANGGNSAGGTGDHATYVSMMNANMLSYTAGMNIASMGTATYTAR